jgi:hypothetical protein
VWRNWKGLALAHSGQVRTSAAGACHWLSIGSPKAPRPAPSEKESGKWGLAASDGSGRVARQFWQGADLWQKALDSDTLDIARMEWMA